MIDMDEIMDIKIQKKGKKNPPHNTLRFKVLVYIQKTKTERIKRITIAKEVNLLKAQIQVNVNIIYSWLG